MLINIDYSDQSFMAAVTVLNGRPHGLETEKTVSDIITSTSLKKIRSKGELVCEENDVETYIFNNKLVSIMDKREVISSEIALMFIPEDKKKEIFERVLNLAPAQA